MYQPRRDYRFEYVTDVASFIEDRQCKTCKFKSDRIEYPMCFEIEGGLFLERPVEDLDDRGDEGVVCTKYEPEPVEPTLVEKLQIPLWED